MEMDFSFRRYFDEKHTRFEKDMSPGIEFKDVPDEAESIVVIMEDPDADGDEVFTNWLIWDIPPKEDLEENLPDQKELENGAVQGENDYDEIGYGGPKPPRGTFHKYEIKAYALDKKLNLEPGTRKNELELAMQDHILDRAEEEVPYKRDYDSSNIEM